MADKPRLIDSIGYHLQVSMEHWAEGSSRIDKHGLFLTWETTHQEPMFQAHTVFTTGEGANQHSENHCECLWKWPQKQIPVTSTGCGRASQTQRSPCSAEKASATSNSSKYCSPGICILLFCLLHLKFNLLIDTQELQAKTPVSLFTSVL